MVDSVQSPSGAAAPYDPKGGSPVTSEVNGDLGKDDFMRLLVAQLSNQDPMEPTDPTEFVSQLSQFSQLEQLIGVQQGLELIAITQTAGTSAQMVSFIGKEVAFEGSTLVVHEGDTREPIQIDLADDAASVELTITDKRGTVVQQLPLGAMAEGEHTYHVDVAGLDLEPGTYSLAVSAKNADGSSVDSALHGRGEVTAVTFENGFPQLVLADGRHLSLAQILRVLGDGAAAPPEHTVPHEDDEAGQGALPASPGLPDRAHKRDTSFGQRPTSPDPTTP